jgi:hypothetical protein
LNSTQTASPLEKFSILKTIRFRCLLQANTAANGNNWTAPPTAQEDGIIIKSFIKPPMKYA